MVRERMSRPNWSVPNQYAADGPCSRSNGCCEMGSYGGRAEYREERETQGDQAEDQARPAAAAGHQTTPQPLTLGRRFLGLEPGDLVGGHAVRTRGSMTR